MRVVTGRYGHTSVRDISVSESSPWCSRVVFTDFPSYLTAQLLETRMLGHIEAP